MCRNLEAIASLFAGLDAKRTEATNTNDITLRREADVQGSRLANQLLQEGYIPKLIEIGTQWCVIPPPLRLPVFTSVRRLYSDHARWWVVA